MKRRDLGLIAHFLATSLLCSGVSAQQDPLPSQAGTHVSASNSIQSLLVTQQSGNTVVKVGLRQPAAKAPSSFSVANPARVVFDFADTDNLSGRNSQTINEGELRSVNIVQVGDRTRLVLNLKKMGNYQTQIEGNVFLVTLAPSSIEGTLTQSTQHFVGDTRSADTRSVRDLKFRRGKSGEGLITVDLSDPNTSIDVRQQGAGLVVEFQKIQLAEELRRRLDVTDFATPVTTVTTTRQGENARIAIAAQGLWEHTAYQSENQFIVEVKPLKEDPSKLFQGSQRQGYQGDKVSLNFQNIPLRELLHVFADITSFNIVISDTVAGNVSLRLNDVPWDQALDIVLKQKGLAMRKNGNVIWIAPGDELAAREKLELESQIAISDLEPVRTESFQLNYQKADVVEKMIRGISTVSGIGGGGPQTAGTAGKGSPRVLSERGSAIFDQRTNKLFVTDTPSKLADVRRLLAEIDVPVRQVLIEARIVEADDTFAKSLGARLGGSDNKGLALGGHQLGNARWGISGTSSDANRLLSYAPRNVWDGSGYVGTPGAYVPTGRITDITDTGKLTFEQGSPQTSVVYQDQQFVNLPVTNAAGQFALSLFSKNLTHLLTLEISAMESDGKGKTISSPRVLTADQKEATIEDGQELPYWSASSSGATTVAYRKAVLSLNVTPQITPDGKVLMNLKINKDNVNPKLSTSYGLAIDTKNVKTDVLVENGGTVVIGGIYVQESRNTVTRVPFFGDLPVLGNLFRKTDNADNRRELLIFVTPKIVADTLSLR
jgi:type IV pilus assembly protein PilQ